MWDCLTSDFVPDEPKFNFLFNKDDGTLNLETVSLVPANYTWMFCSKSNDRYDYLHSRSAQRAF